MFFAVADAEPHQSLWRHVQAFFQTIAAVAVHFDEETLGEFTKINLVKLRFGFLRCDVSLRRWTFGRFAPVHRDAEVIGQPAERCSEVQIEQPCKRRDAVARCRVAAASEALSAMNRSVPTA